MSNETFTIDNDFLNAAKDACNSIESDKTRNRSIANVIGAKLAKVFINNADVTTGLHNIPQILENYDISDIYINDLYFDVRVYKNANELSVPKSHFDNDLLPYAYIFIKLDEDLANASITGFITPDSINTETSKYGYYIIKEDDLLPIDSFENFENSMTERDITSNIEFKDALLFDLLDGKLVLSEFNSLLKHLLTDKEARQKLIDAAKAQTIFKFVSTNINSEDLPEKNIEENRIDEIINYDETNFDENINSKNEDLEFKSLENSELYRDFEEASKETEVINSVNYEEENSYAKLEFIEDEPAETISGPEIEQSDENHDYDSENIQQDNISLETSDRPIEDLFNQDEVPIELLENEKVSATLKNKKLPAVILGILILVITLGYFLFTKNQSEQPQLNVENSLNQENINPTNNKTVEPVAEVMPIETVENVKKELPTNEGNAISIPAIEQNLDASVSIADLAINWEVPSGYLANPGIKRYFVRMGKIIQLNLKTELMLINKSPITNKIVIELEFNKKSNKFEIKNFTASSGEKTIDDLVKNTVTNTLDMNSKINMKMFSNIVGNPVLIIRL